MKKQKRPDFTNLDVFLGDHGEIRTPKPCSTTPSRWRVYQFHHMAFFDLGANVAILLKDAKYNLKTFAFFEKDDPRTGKNSYFYFSKSRLKVQVVWHWN